jgi:hypothetical protein
MNRTGYRIHCWDWIPDLAKEKSGIEYGLLVGFDKKLTMAS